VGHYREHPVVDQRDQFVGRNDEDREGALPYLRRRIVPVLPDAGDAERTAITSGNRIPPPARIFLKKAVYRHDAAPLAIGIAEPIILGDGFGGRMDRREIRKLLAAEDEAREIASKHDAFGRDWRDPDFATCDCMETSETHVFGDVVFRSEPVAVEGRKHAAKRR
jgi:hypothetical protein